MRAQLCVWRFFPIVNFIDLASADWEIRRAHDVFPHFSFIRFNDQRARAQSAENVLLRNHFTTRRNWFTYSTIARCDTLALLLCFLCSFNRSGFVLCSLVFFVVRSLLSWAQSAFKLLQIDISLCKWHKNKKKSYFLFRQAEHWIDWSFSINLCIVFHNSSIFLSLSLCACARTEYVWYFF